MIPSFAPAVIALEAELARRLKTKAPTALLNIVDLYLAEVVSVIEHHVHNRTLAKELAQECFIKVWSRAAQVKEQPGSLGPWIFMIAREVALDYLKGKDRFEGEPSEEIGYHVAELTLTQQEMLEMAFSLGMSNAEIAFHLNVSLATVQAVLRLAFEHSAVMAQSGNPLLQFNQREVTQCHP